MKPAYRRVSERIWPCFSRLAAGLALAAALASPARADDTQRAKELFQQGTTLFNVGEFDKAIEAWQQGYKEKPDPGFLYNIGQAYRLKGDAPKAIFFYRGYLRNSPKAANRADVEAKIAALQKGVEEHPAATPPATPPPVTPPPSVPPAVTPPPRAATPPPAPRPAPVQARPAPLSPPPVVAPPLPAGTPSGASSPDMVAVKAPEPEPVGRTPHVDLGFGLGFHSFTSGLKIMGDAPAQFGWSLQGGVTIGDGPLSFRIGGALTRTSLQEGSGLTSNKLGFTSLVAEPSVRARLIEQRLYLTGGLGIGFMVFSGVKSTSVVLGTPPTGKSFDPKGAQVGLELRPALNLQLRLIGPVAVFASPALAFTPQKTNYQGTLGRFELMFGVAALF
jgi:outer membrane biosynthesis protein TonB